MSADEPRGAVPGDSVPGDGPAPAAAGGHGPAPPAAPPPCALCEATDWRLLEEQIHDLASNSTGESFDLWRCGGCGAGRTWPVAEETAGYYPETYSLHGDAGLRTELRWHARFTGFSVAWRLKSLPLVGRHASRGLQRFGGETWHELARYAPGRRFALLDVGCGSGSFPRNLRRLGVDAAGVEPSGAAAAAARRIGLTCETGTIHTATFAPHRFDVVRFCHVLEHVHDPLADLKAAHRLLRPGGVVVVRVPAWDSLQAELFGRSWRPLDIPRHLWHFTRPALESVLERSGFHEASWEGLNQDWVYSSFMIELLGEGHDAAKVHRALGAQRSALDELGAAFVTAGDITEWFVVARRR